MPAVPMNQLITVHKMKIDSNGNPILDRNGHTIVDEEIEMKCRVDEGSTVVKNRTSGTISNQTIVASARILLDKLANIKYIDEIEFTNELSEKIRKQPKEINVKRNIGGKPILTEVFI